MIFFDCATAPNPRRARMLIVEKGLSPERREVSIAKSEQLEPAFLAINPRATLPVLVTDSGVALSENLGIAAYLDAAFPDPPMMGQTPEERGLVLMWNALCEMHGGQPIGEALRNGNPKMRDRAIPGPVDYAQIPELAERGLARTDGFFNMLEDRLADSPYLAGDSFTYADITGYVFVDFARVIRKRIPEQNTATLDWFDRISNRPSARA